MFFEIKLRNIKYLTNISKLILYKEILRFQYIIFKKYTNIEPI